MTATWLFLEDVSDIKSIGAPVAESTRLHQQDAHVITGLLSALALDVVGQPDAQSTRIPTAIELGTPPVAESTRLTAVHRHVDAHTPRKALASSLSLDVVGQPDAQSTRIPTAIELGTPPVVESTRLTAVHRHVANVDAHTPRKALSSSLPTSALTPLLRKANPLKITNFKCSICKREFLFKLHMYAHMKEKHGSLSESSTDSSSSLSCDECGEEFDTKGHLKGHSFLHSPEYPYNCNVCTRGFFFKCNFKAHMISHAKDCPFTCTICDKGFFFKCHLDDHISKSYFSCSMSQHTPRK
ncbi:unnamed protein product [Meganyctiphanes norvegica]|uniref:C2H2-type domain-containing protein n=1 Tax=Meganyctiphanes norvegica TaxID=48144 RepID=A0AAV2Q4U6_MEGNR